MAHPLEQRYGGLSAHLHARAAAGETRVTLPFAVIEATLLGRPLPATARHPRGHRQWWRGRGTNYPHGWYGWQRVGWTLETVDLATETVTFTRGDAGEQVI